MATVGNGAYSYEPMESWAKLPPGWSFKEIGGVGVDRSDNVFVFNRGEHPMIVFDREGNFLRSFGEGLCGPTGRKPSETNRGRIICARCTSSGRWDRSART